MPTKPDDNLSTTQLAALDRAHIWHPFTPMKPWCESIDFPIISRGEREFLFDTEGRKYLDASSSIWCNVHGHCIPEIDAAIKAQLAKVAHTTLLGAANIPSILLAKKLADLARTCGLDLPRIFYSDNGSTAVEVAVKMAYQYHTITPSSGNWKLKTGNSPRFIAFQNSYHGDTLGAVSLGGIPAFHSTFRDLCFPTDFIPWNSSSTLRDLTTQLESLLTQNPAAHAAVIIEPLIQGAGGMHLFPKNFLRAVRDLCDQHHTLLIADEVMTGFGRTGKMFACQHEQVTPDFLCLSKGLTGGTMPLGVTMTSEKIFAAFYADPRELKTFFHGHTYTGHPLACAAAIASLDLFEKNNLLAHVASLEKILAASLAAARGKPFVHATRHLGLIGAIELRDTNGQPFDFHLRIGGALCRTLRDLQPVGLLLRPLGDVIVLMPPLAISESNLRYLCDSVLESLNTLPRLIDEKRRNRP